MIGRYVTNVRDFFTFAASSPTTIPFMPEKTLRLLTDATNDERPVYLAGSFNNWETGREDYRMEAGGAAGEYHYTFDFPDAAGYIEYKYTRGGWECVELGEHGESIDNRRRELSDAWDAPDRVPSWANAGLHYTEQFLPKIVVINESFEIPELIRTRRVAALLPHDYYETKKRYPVLYLQDGQNLFDENAPYGSWGVDKRVANMAGRGKGGIIIVAIDHAQDKRISEFTPSFKTTLGRGEGREYISFLANSLKPYIDEHFRTLPDAQNTGIGGSSLGGLISIYAGLMYPETYSKLMIFSPSLWVTPNIPFHLMKLSHRFDGRIYLYGGEAESATMVPNMRRFEEEFTRQVAGGKVVFRTEVDPEGQHNEARWGVEFPQAVEWLFPELS
ncbi:MAG: alpha/beta hydrolase-fold protein [Bacteroidota bacterium]